MTAWANQVSGLIIGLVGWTVWSMNNILCSLHVSYLWLFDVCGVMLCYNESCVMLCGIPLDIRVMLCILWLLRCCMMHDSSIRYAMCHGHACTRCVAYGCMADVSILVIHPGCMVAWQMSQSWLHMVACCPWLHVFILDRPLLHFAYSHVTLFSLIVR